MKPLLINLDLKNNSYEDIELKQGCQDTLISTITDLGEVCDLTGQIISVEMLKADDTFIIQSTDITVLNNKITIILNKDLTRVAGKGKLQIRMTKNGVVSGSWVVDVRIRKGAIDGNIGASGNIVTIKEELDKSIVNAKLENDKTQELIQSGGAATKGQVAEISASLTEKVNKSDLTTGGDSINGWQKNSITGILEQWGVISVSGQAPNAWGIGWSIAYPMKFKNIKTLDIQILFDGNNNDSDLRVCPYLTDNNGSFQYHTKVGGNGTIKFRWSAKGEY